MRLEEAVKRDFRRKKSLGSLKERLDRRKVESDGACVDGARSQGEQEHSTARLEP